MSHQNPFDPPQPLDSNPFSDPSRSGASANPFQHANDSAFSLESADTERAPGGSKPAGGAGNAYGGYGFSTGASQAESGTGGRSQKEIELERRERELREREDTLRQREAAVGAKENNWPPFFPFIHHDLTLLPSEHKTVGKFLYTQWLALAVTLILNLVGCILLLISGAAEGGADMGASVMYVPVIGVLSFVTWYRPIYLGLSRTEGKAMAFFFYIYFLFAGFHLLFSIYMAVGIPSTGSAGLINTIASFARGSIVTGIFGALASVGWVLQAAAGGILYKRIWDFKNGNGDINFAAASDAFKSASIKTIILHQGRI
ncbi:scamp family-domain-containing protein [Dioszegia hungarica]|uniref:Scamp family-domain-containing protein n=1 Tax=Dioszegia hungarica TaxID=4972 RepID=A0AA38HEX5_9TREE|nr:scamp family-domain-containing protein [Dioszegia hungarica]KAI9637689.1 scamp family-domain-containing protein [Dioszegia hungarica]